MKKFDQLPLLESTLTNLLNKTEKDWGYCQIKKKDNDYILHLLGSDEAMLRLSRNESNHLYELFWHEKSRPAVYVKTKLNKIYNKETRTYSKQRVYEVYYQHNGDALTYSINQMFAQLIKAKILSATSKSTKEDEKPPIVTLVED